MGLRMDNDWDDYWDDEFTEIMNDVAHEYAHYPLVNVYIAIENGHRKFVDFPMKNGDFPWL